jgi:hypothetical protein
MAARWVQVVGAALAWIVFVPVFELARAGVERLGLGGRKGAAAPVERAAGSRTPVAPTHRRRAA